MCTFLAPSVGLGTSQHLVGRWPLAVSAGLMERSSRALVAALGPLSIGHLLAMLLVLSAGLMLVPIYLGLCRASDLDRGHEAAGALITAFSAWPCGSPLSILSR